MSIKKLAVKTDTRIVKLQSALQAKIKAEEIAERSVRIESGQKQVKIGPGWNARKEWDDTLEEAIATLTQSERTMGFSSQTLGAWRGARSEVDKIRWGILEAEAVHTEHGWERAYLVTNSDGHVHRWTACATCFPTTQFEWLIEYSGSGEEEIVAAAGESACTVCYPTAPTDSLTRPCTILSKDRVVKDAAREDREIAKREREATRVAKSPTKDGADLWVSSDRFYPTARDARGTVFTSERAATALWVEIESAEALGWRDHMLPGEAQREAQRIIVGALAEKHGRSVDDQLRILRGKAAAKVKRDIRAGACVSWV